MRSATAASKRATGQQAQRVSPVHTRELPVTPEEGRGESWPPILQFSRSKQMGKVSGALAGSEGGQVLLAHQLPAQRGQPPQQFPRMGSAGEP